MILGLGIYSTISAFPEKTPDYRPTVTMKINIEETPGFNIYARKNPAMPLDERINTVLTGKGTYSHLIPERIGKGKLRFDKAVVGDPVFHHRENQAYDMTGDGKPDTFVQVYENSEYQKIMIASVRNKVFAYGFSLAPIIPEDGTFNFLIIDKELKGNFNERRAMKDRIPNSYLEEILKN